MATETTPNGDTKRRATFRLSEETLRKLDELSADWKRTPALSIEYLVDRAYKSQRLDGEGSKEAHQ